MSKIDKLRDKWNSLSSDDQLAVAGALVIGAFVAVFLLILIVALIKELFVPALIALAVYSVGVKKWNWPVPKKIKQFFVK